MALHMPPKGTPSQSTGDSLTKKVESSYRELSAVAAALNTVSDELGKSVAELDSALKKLNLGVSVWVKLRGFDGDPTYDTSFWSEDLGYSKIGGKWGISLRTVHGDICDPDLAVIEEWLFNDGPRTLRLSAIDKIPELLEKLSKEAVETTNKIKAKLAEAQQVATVVREAAEESTRKAVEALRSSVQEQKK
jgi:prefoldin subunit 5